MAIHRGDPIPGTCADVGHLIFEVPSGPTTLGTLPGAQPGGRLALASRGDEYRAQVEATDPAGRLVVCGGSLGQAGFLPRIALLRPPPVPPGTLPPCVGFTPRIGVDIGARYANNFNHPATVCFDHGSHHALDPDVDLPFSMAIPSAGPDIPAGSVTVTRGGAHGETISYSWSLGNGDSRAGSVTYGFHFSGGEPTCINYSFRDAFGGDGLRSGGSATHATSCDCEGHGCGTPFAFFTENQTISISLP